MVSVAKTEDSHLTRGYTLTLVVPAKTISVEVSTPCRKCVKPSTCPWFMLPTIQEIDLDFFPVPVFNQETNFILPFLWPDCMMVAMRMGGEEVGVSPSHEPTPILTTTPI